MNRILALFTAIFITFFILSCASLSPNNKYLIGTWKVEKVERHNIPNPPIQTAANGQTKASADAAKQAAKTEERLERIIKTRLNSTLTINKDKTAVQESEDRTIHGTWKLKNKGKRILVTSKEPDRKITIDILRMNDTSAVFLENLPVGSLKVTYKKEKK
jgi:hypothetical protein